ncbi:hypothetical protein MA20_10030 [Bradyrhizobium japonicum]|jgi:hypothetical protein|uniref:Uncharacterized protein n=1 Tax=Bradyrhizobium japonicum TaxID=375 RepID=A0A0A3XZM1_BRAJP|nr:hypothetical protein RN69_36780 [Bradyrhizobium japonicum]MCS3899013.1 hypothetical protein [Bradyrhizobium japonicum USDA 38]BAL12823.1 hypothetical protein BJ6T_75770 [Bradyrhizobium japonicum USDA 6]KGT79840.1 hypothetical protein MA20_10030 [Bradyrhizobium japonicum]KMJ96418.1 hypothetical protein CF64_26170 [Bradyrhizobium japonicum]
MPVLDLPYWLIIAGSALVLGGLIGLGVSRNKRVESDPIMLPGDLTTWKAEGSETSDLAAARDSHR